MAINKTKSVVLPSSASSFDIADSLRQQSVMGNIKGTAKEALILSHLVVRTASDILCFVSDAVKSDNNEGAIK